MERRFKVSAYSVVYICDKCDLGEMLPTDKLSGTIPLKFEHKCKNCGTLSYLPKKYPYITHE